MKTFFLATAFVFLPVAAFAHEEGIEITNIAEADWVGPLVALGVIAVAILLARILNKKQS